jgi:hypothetical protein
MRGFPRGMIARKNYWGRRQGYQLEPLASRRSSKPKTIVLPVGRPSPFGTSSCTLLPNAAIPPFRIKEE